jgi:anaerobic nitric oxide reductase transcription regulator
MTLEPQVLDLDVSAGASSARAMLEEPAESLEAPLQPLSETVDACQRQAILQALDRCGQNWAGAARLLEVDPSNLHKLARRLGLK